MLEVSPTPYPHKPLKSIGEVSELLEETIA